MGHGNLWHDESHQSIQRRGWALAAVQQAGGLHYPDMSLLQRTTGSVITSINVSCMEDDMKRFVLSTIAALAAPLPMLCAAARPASGTEGPAPAPHCLDTSNVQLVRQAETDSIAVRTADGTAFRLDFKTDCPGVMNGKDMGLDAPGGWACGRQDERLMVDGQRCDISAVAPIDSRTFAVISRESSRRYMKTLPALNVTATSIEKERRRRLRGSPEFCFATRDVRSWNTSPKGFTVETNPRRNGGNRFYRIETGGCRDYSGFHTVQFASGLKNGLVCGNPGDNMTAVVLSPAAMVEVLVPGSRCPVTMVYPVD